MLGDEVAYEEQLKSKEVAKLTRWVFLTDFKKINLFSMVSQKKSPGYKKKYGLWKASNISCVPLKFHYNWRK